MESELETSLDTRFNLAAWLTHQFIESRLTVLLLIAVLLLGGLGLLLTPREENPQIIVPVAEISVPFPSALPSEVEQLLLTPLESRLIAIAGVKHVYGTALEGLAKVQVEFEVGENKTEAFVRLYDQVLRYRSVLPPGAGEPQLQMIDVDDVPIFVVTLAADEYHRQELTRIAEQLGEKLLSVPGVGQINQVGSWPQAVRVIIKPGQLQALGLSLNDLEQAIQATHINGLIDTRIRQDRVVTLSLDNQLTHLDDLKNSVVSATQGKILRLGEIADITDQPSLIPKTYSRFSFGRADARFETFQGKQMTAIHLAVAKRPGVNAVSLTRALRERINFMQDTWLPRTIQVVITRDDGIKANNTVNTLIIHLMMAIGAVSVILSIFLGLRAALIVMLVIPLVFAVVMGMDWLYGPTLNRITLYALILALGMLVDDAIVVIENIHRHYQALPPGAQKKSRSYHAILATGEIGNPTTLATLAVVIVFLSLLMVTGMLGQYFYPMAFNVPVAMLASLLIAYTVTPWAARRFLISSHSEQPIKIQQYYRLLLNTLLHYRWWRWLFFLLTLIIFGLSLLQPAWQFIRPQGVSGEVSYWGIPLAFLPKDDKNTFLITFHLPDNTPLENTDRVVREIETVLSNSLYVTDYQSFIGIPAVIDFNGQLRGSGANVGSQFAEIRVNLIDKHERNITSINIVKQFRRVITPILQNYPEASIQLVEDPPGPPVRATLLAEIYGTDQPTLEALAKTVNIAFRQTWDMAEVWASIPTEITEYWLRVQADKAAMAGVSVREVGQTLKDFVAGKLLGYLHVKDERHAVPIYLQVPESEPIEPEWLASAFIISPDKQAIPLSSLVQVSLAQRPHPLFHQDGELVVYVGGELNASAPVYAILSLDARLDGMRISDHENLHTTNLGLQPVAPNSLGGYRLHWAGEHRLTLDAFRDMGLALGLALISIYLLLVGYYRSFLLPILVMVSVPLSLPGVFMGHWLLNQTFSAASMVGVIALAGIVVRNALLLIDFNQELRQKGFSMQAAASESGALRLRPILLTTLAIVLGTVIMIPDPVFGGLAISLIFGAVSSALFTVLVVPLLSMSYV
jgi:multidrug efflux pump subunit AcrB